MKPFNPKSTVFTNEMLDIIMPMVSPSAWKILCFAMRKTAGWQDLATESGRKESDIISLSQFETGCGLSRPTVIDAIKECIDNGYLLRTEAGQSFSYRLNTEYELPESNSFTSKESLPVTSKESLQTNNKTINSKKSRDEESYKQDIQKSLDRGMSRKSGGLEDYPEEIREVLLEFVNLWKMKLPAKTQKSYWIIGGRELLDACGELGVEVLREVRKDFETFMNNHQGIAPFTVSSPKSLVNPARGKAGWMRDSKAKSEFIIPQGASEVWIGGQRYT